MSIRTLLMTALLGLQVGYGSIAEAAEYRRFSLTDGRAFVAEIVSTEANGFQVNIAQGQLFVTYEQIDDMMSVEATAFEVERPWVIYLADGPMSADLQAKLYDLPNLMVLGKDKPVPHAIKDTVSACGVEVGCLSAASSTEPWMFVITNQVNSDGSILFNSAINTRDGISAVEVKNMATIDWEQTLSTLLLLEVDLPEDVLAFEPPPLSHIRPPVDPEELRLGASLMPVPGFTHIRDGHVRESVRAWGVVVPVTAAWVGAVGYAAPNRRQHIGLSLVGFYAITVAVNEINQR